MQQSMKNSLIIALLLLPLWTFSQIIGTNLGQTITVDFDTPTTGVCDGPIQGTGFTSNPTAGSGMMDSDAIAFSGLIDPVSMDFGGTATTGDAARGIANNGNNGSGFYAFEPTNGSGRAFGFQPSVNHFNPGTITIKFTNMTGEPINEFSVGLDIYLKNDSDRSTTYNIGVSADGINFETQPGFSTSLVPGFLGSGWLGPNSFLIGSQLSINQEVCSPEPILAGDSFFLRFEISDDGVGTDTAGDELAFDNIRFSIANRAYCAATDVTEVSQMISSDNTSSTVTWTNPVGCYDAVVVVASEDFPVTENVRETTMGGLTLAEIDETTNVNNNWPDNSTDNEIFELTEGVAGTAGQDFIVYKGTGTSVDVTGLDPNKDYYFRVLAVSSGCDWATGVDVTTVPLATDLLSFQGKQNKENIALSWQAVHDENHSHTHIERSFDGQDFGQLATVNSSSHHGNSVSYYTDFQPNRGNNYYRLCMVEQDGRKTYSAILNIDFQQDELIQIIPFPKEGRLQLSGGEEWEGQPYWIYNVMGEIQSAGVFSAEIRKLPSAQGIYYLKIGDLPALNFLWMP